MVTAVLPAVTGGEGRSLTYARADGSGGEQSQTAIHSQSPSDESAGVSPADSQESVTSELTITPRLFLSQQQQQQHQQYPVASPATAVPARVKTPIRDRGNTDASRLAGYVGTLTGCGAVLALVVLLPLPAHFERVGHSPATSIQLSYYVAALLALGVSLGCWIGLRGLPDERASGRHRVQQGALLQRSAGPSTPGDRQFTGGGSATAIAAETYFQRFIMSIRLGIRRPGIGLAYVGGLIARASSVGISLFIPLYVSEYYRHAGLCQVHSGTARAGTRSSDDIKHSCPRAYVVASILTGTSQLTALCCAPLFGYLSAHARHHYQRRRGPWQWQHWPLLAAAVVGAAGNVLFVSLDSPGIDRPGLDGGEDGEQVGGIGGVMAAMVLIGTGQIGAIVCSLGLLSNEVLGVGENEGAGEGEQGPAASSFAEGDVEEARDMTSPSPSPLSSPSSSPSQSQPAPTSERQPLLAPRESQAQAQAPFSSRNHLLYLTTTAHPRQSAAAQTPKTTATTLIPLKGAVAGTYSLCGGAGILLLTKAGGLLADRASAAAPFALLAGFNGLLVVWWVGLGLGLGLRG